MEHVAPYLAMPGVCPDPVFVIGSPRSGTTAMAQSLNRHPDLRVGKESYVLHDFFLNGRPERVWENHTTRATPSWLAFEQVERDEFLAFVGLGFNALFSSRAEGKRWIDQTPLYTPMVSTLAAMFPGAKFVHIVRDGRHVVRSMLNFERKFDDSVLSAARPNEIPTWSNDLRLGCDTWSTWVTAALDFADAHPERCITVWNERVSADPVTSFEAIHGFLGLRPHPGSANFFGKKRINSSWMRDPSRPEDDDWEGWDRRKRKLFVDVAGATMARAGYGTTADLKRWADAVT
jgi:hypothetical protein